MGEPLYFPLFVDLSDKKVLVVGGGKIALRRIRTLADFTAGITVVAPEIHPELLPLEEAGRLRVLRKSYDPGDLNGMDLVLAAGPQELNEAVGADCRRLGIPVNVSSDRRECDFYFPGIARRGDLVAGVTASGRDHAGAKKLTEAIRDLLEDFES
jgi:siroheme synthase-like protein